MRLRSLLFAALFGSAAWMLRIPDPEPHDHSSLHAPGEAACPSCKPVRPVRLEVVCAPHPSGTGDLCVTASVETDLDLGPVQIRCDLPASASAVAGGGGWDGLLPAGASAAHAMRVRAPAGGTATVTLTAADASGHVWTLERSVPLGVTAGKPRGTFRHETAPDGSRMKVYE